MAMLAQTELSLQFTGFKNVDLFSQGIYQVRVRTIGMRSRRVGVPSTIHEAPMPSLCEAPAHKVSRELLLPPHILASTRDFCTGSFRVRYVDEEVMLRSMVRFQLKLAVEMDRPSGHIKHDSSPASAAQVEPVVVELRLMHARSTTQFTGSNVEKLSEALFTQVAIQTLKVQLPLGGCSAFFPVTFADWHFSFMPLILHAALLEFSLSGVGEAPLKLQPARRNRAARIRPTVAAVTPKVMRQGRNAAKPKQSGESDDIDNLFNAAADIQSVPAPSGMRGEHALARLIAHTLATPEADIAADIAACAHHAALPQHAGGTASASSVLLSPCATAPRASGLHGPREGRASLRVAALSEIEIELARQMLHAQVRSLVRTYTALSSRVAALCAVELRSDGTGKVEGLTSNLTATLHGVTASLNGGNDKVEALPPVLPTLPDGISLLPAPDAAEDACQESDGNVPSAPVSAAAPASFGCKEAVLSSVSATRAPLLPFVPREGALSRMIQRQPREEVVRGATIPEFATRGAWGTREEAPRDDVADAALAAESVAERLAFVPWPAEELGWRAFVSLHQLSAQLWCLWDRFLREALPHVDGLTCALSNGFLRAQHERFGESLLREPRPFEHRAYMSHGERGIDPSVIAQSLRGSSHFKGLPPMPLQDILLRPEEQPVLIEQRHSRCCSSVQTLLCFRSGACELLRVAEDGAGDEVGKDGETCRGRASGLAGGDFLGKTRHESKIYGGDDKCDSVCSPFAPQLRLSWMREATVKGTGDARTQPYANVGAGGGGGTQGIHLFVLVHGFHGNSFDLRGMRNQLALMLPEKTSARFLLSASNEQHTAVCSFAQLGDNLAREIDAFIDAEGISGGLSRVSFICHSFGAIICRAALRTKALEPLLPKLHAYVSFSGPHLGMLYSSNLLVELGVWGLRRWRNAHCLTELSLKDGVEPHRCYLFELSCDDKLRHFRNILLVSSSEDRYVPHHSARIQLCPEAMHDTKYGSTFVGMVHNLLAPLECEHILHIDASFPAPAATRISAQLDAAIGRFAHIAFLEQHAFIQMFVHMYLPYMC